MSPLHRLASIPSEPGAWGEAGAATYALWLALGLIVPDTWTTTSVVITDIAGHFGAVTCCLWFLVMAVLPFAAIAHGCLIGRVITAGITMFSWSVLLALSAWRHGIFAPHVGTYLVCIVATLASEYRLTRDGWVGGRWTAKISFPT